MVPRPRCKLAGKDAEPMLKLFEALEDHDDVAEGLRELRHRRRGILAAAGFSE